MTEAEEIAADPTVQELKKPPPSLTAPRTGWAKVRMVTRMVLRLIGIVALAVALYALQQQGQTATCVNDTLATRNAPANAEIDAQIKKAEADLAALKKIRTQPAAGFREYTQAAERFVAQLQAVRDARNANPLGRC